MNRIRTVSAGLICAALTTVAGCGAGDAEPTTGPAPAATTASAVTDAALCESVKTAGEQMKTQFIEVFKDSEKPTPAVYRKILDALGSRLDAAVAGAGDGPVPTAVRAFTAETAKASAAADPAGAINTPAFEQTAKGITAACKPAGVDANF